MTTEPSSDEQETVKAIRHTHLHGHKPRWHQKSIAHEHEHEHPDGDTNHQTSDHRDDQI